MIRWLSYVLLFTPLPVLAGIVHVEAVRNGSAVEVTASAELAVDPMIAWRVLTDYNHYSEFIPDMRSSRVVGTVPELLVEQRGDARFLFVSHAVEVTLAVTETPYRSVRSRAVAGNVRELSGHYDLQPTPDGVRFVYTGRIVPDSITPVWLNLIVIRQNIGRQFMAMVREIERRGAGVRSVVGAPPAGAVTP